MVHACDKRNDKWTHTKGTEPAQKSEGNDGGMQQEMEVKVKFRITNNSEEYCVCIYKILS